MSKLTFSLGVYTKHVLTLCHRVTYKDVIAILRVVHGSCILTFSYTTSYTFVSCFVLLIISRLSRA